MSLYGREREIAALCGLVDGVRDARSGVLVLRGEAGIGKSALLGEALGGASDMRVLRAAGIETEAELAFAGLHQLVRPVQSLLSELPPLQAAALRAALGFGRRHGGDRFLIGAGLLELLAAAAEERPLLCVIDDAHWLDGASADALTFAARRLHAEPVAMIFAARDETGHAFESTGLPELRVGELDPRAAEALLEARAGQPVPPHLRDQLLERAHGNPLALLELPFEGSGLEPGQLSPAIADAFLARTRSLPDSAQLLLLLAAADDTGDPATVLRAASFLQIAETETETLENAGLLRVTAGGVEFRHPLVRAAVRDAAPFSQRQAVHLALAETLDDDRRAWHQAAALLRPDEGVADALERSAERARSRVGYGAAATALERAAAITADERKRASRLVMAAEAAWLAGRTAASRALLDQASQLPAALTAVVDIDYLRGLIEVAEGSPMDAYDLLVEAAERIASTDPDRARKMLLQAREAAVLSADAAAEARVSRQTALAIATATADPFPSEFLSGMAGWLEGDVASAVACLKDALDHADASADPRRLFWAGVAAFVLGYDDHTRRFLQRNVAQARADGAVTMLAQALTMQASGELVEGRAASARTHAVEGLSLARATGQPNIACFHLSILARVAASFGTTEETSSLAAESRKLAIDRRLPMCDHNASIALAELALANAQAEHALTHLNTVLEQGTEVGAPLMRHHGILTFVEASMLAEHRHDARDALDAFERWFSATGSVPNLALLARGRALLADDERAHEQFEAALRLHGSAARPYDRARTELLYGAWLRRHRHRLDAREHLRVALDLFERLAAKPWAERARSELRASGETARRAAPTSLEHLTPQELQVARLVAAGASSKEVAGRLFLSPRTIDAHLRSIFAKLGIASRNALRDIDLRDTHEKTDSPTQENRG